VNAAGGVEATVVPEYVTRNTAVPVAATVNQLAGRLYVQSPLPEEATPVQDSVVLLPLVSTMSITTERPDVWTRLPPAASVTTKLSHNVLKSTYTVAVLRMPRIVAARLGSTEYAELVARVVPPAVSVPERLNPMVPVEPGCLLDNPTAARETRPVMLAGRGSVSSGVAGPTPKPRRPPVKRRL